MFRTSITSLIIASPVAALADAPNVVTDIAPVHSLVAQVMGDLGQPELLVSGNASPHSFALRPSQAQALENAQVVFFIGEDLTPWLEPVLERVASKATLVELLHLPQTTTLEFRNEAAFAHDDDDDHAEHDDHDKHDDHDDHAEHDDHDKHDDHDDHAEHDDHDKHDDHDDHAEHDDHDKHDDHDDHAEHDDHDDHAEQDEHEGHDDHAGHNHDGVDPHAWLSPDNAAVWLDAIAATLSAQDPEHASNYFTNAASAKEELAATVAEVEKTLLPTKGKKYVVFHDAYHYFEESFDVEVSGAISLGDATTPGPARVERIQNLVRELNISCAFSEPQYSEGLVKTVLEGTDAQSAVLDPLGARLPIGTSHYNALLRDLATSIAGC